MAVHLDACIHCNLCVRACREVQVNDVIGMAYRDASAKIVFDFDDPMGDSTCVACGECVQACPTGALMPAASSIERGDATPGRPRASTSRSAPTAASAARSPITSRTTGIALRRRPRRAGQPQPAVRQGPLRLRLRQPPAPPDPAADPQGRRAASTSSDDDRPGQLRWTHFREASWEEALDRAADGLRRDPRPARRPRRSPASARPRARTRRPISSRSWCAPASAPTTSITARGSATPPRSRR